MNPIATRTCSRCHHTKNLPIRTIGTQSTECWSRRPGIDSVHDPSFIPGAFQHESNLSPRKISNFPWPLGFFDWTRERDFGSRIWQHTAKEITKETPVKQLGLTALKLWIQITWWNDLCRVKCYSSHATNSRKCLIHSQPPLQSYDLQDKGQIIFSGRKIICVPEIGTQTRKHVLVTKNSRGGRRTSGKRKKKKDQRHVKETVFHPKTDYSEESTTNQRSFSGCCPREVVQDTKPWPCWEVLRDRE